MPDDPRDPVAERKKQSATHVDLSTFHFVDHVNFELLGGPYGPANKYETSIDLGPRTLSRDELWPIAPVDLQKAQQAKASAQGLAIRGWLDEHRVKERWLYAFSVEKGQAPVFQYELRLDGKGRVAFLDADAFAAARPDADGESDTDYLGRPEWNDTGKTFFQQKLPLGKHNAPIKWHFFGSRLRLRAAAVDELASDDKFLAPDPGYNHFAKDAPTVEGLKVWEIGRLVPVADGVVIRVFDPMRVVDNVRKEFHARLDELLRYSMPVGEGDRLEKTQRRLRVGMIANHVELVVDRASQRNVDVRFEELEPASEVWPKLRDECFTADEIPFLTANEAPTSAYRGSEHFLVMEKRLREEHLRKINRAATKLLLLLTSQPWAFVERQYYVDDAVTDAHGHEIVRVCTEALDRIAETDGGRHYLSKMLEELEENTAPQSIPNGVTLTSFVLLDDVPKGGFDTAKLAVKAGKAPFDLWSKLVNIASAMSKDYLTKVFTRLKPTLTTAQIEMLSKVPQHTHVFAATAFIFANRVHRVYKVAVVEATAMIPGDIDKVFVFTKGGGSVEITRPYIIGLRAADGFEAEAAKFQQKFLGGRKGALTFDHVSTVAGFVALFLNMRELYVSATEKGALDTTKAAFEVFKSVYTLPFVTKAVSKRIADAQLPSLSAGMAKWVTKRGVATIGFVVQAVTVAFATQDTWSKASHGQSEEIVSSGLNLAAQTLLLISAGMVVASGGTATPLAAVLAAAAAVMAIAQFVYDIFRPHEAEFGLRLCLFGKGFHEPTSAPELNARVWQMCPKNDLRHFNPAFTKPALAAYDRQLSAFSNLMHNYHVQVKFPDHLALTGAEIEIMPGALPRDAYFDIRLELTWWFRERDGIIFDSPQDTWSASVSFKLYPYAPAAPPRLEGSPSTQAFETLREAGVVDPAGAPLSISVAREPDHIKTTFDVAKGGFVRFTGKLENVFGGVAQAAKLKIRLRSSYEVKSQIRTHPDGTRSLRIRIDFRSDASPGLGVHAVPVRVSYLVPRIDGIGFDEVTDEVVPSLAVSTNPAGRPRIDIDIPQKGDESTQSHELRDFELGIVLKDVGSPGNETFGGSTTGRLEPGAAIAISEDVFYETSEPHHFRLGYTATILHAGDVANVDFRPHNVTVAPVSSPGQTRAVDGIELEHLVLQYIRNEGLGAPFEEGERGKEIFQSMNRDIEGRFTAKNTSPKNGGPIRLFDRLTLRFTAMVRLETGQEGWTEGDYTEDQKVEWSWPDTTMPENLGDTALIQACKAKICLVLDGDPATKNVLPSDLARADRIAFLEAQCDGNKFQMGWFPPKHRYEDIPGVGLPTSDIEAAIDHCKTG